MNLLDFCAIELSFSWPADNGARLKVSFADITEGTGHFHQDKRIGGGTFSDVYRGIKGNETFAVKVFKQVGYCTPFFTQYTQLSLTVIFSSIKLNLIYTTDSYSPFHKDKQNHVYDNPASCFSPRCCTGAEHIMEAAVGEVPQRNGGSSPVSSV